MNNKFEEILLKTKELEHLKNFEVEVNFRNFEMSITSIASSYKLDEELFDLLTNEINKSLEDSEQLAFILFFVLFTMARRQNFGNILQVNRTDNLHFLPSAPAHPYKWLRVFRKSFLSFFLLGLPYLP